MNARLAEFSRQAEAAWQVREPFLIDFLDNRPGTVIRMRIPAAEQIRKGWEEWSAYGTTY